MQLMSARTIPFAAANSPARGLAREALFRSDDGCILPLSDGELASAAIWLNESDQDQGAAWS